MYIAFGCARDLVSAAVAIIHNRTWITNRMLRTELVEFVINHNSLIISLNGNDINPVITKYMKSIEVGGLLHKTDVSVLK
jgi:hypothetical protein